MICLGATKEDKLVKERIKRLYKIQIENKGVIPASVYENIPPEDRYMLRLEKNGYELMPEYRKKISVVMVGGVFDGLHAGHVFFLEKAKAIGDFLVVVVAQDKHVLKKGRKVVQAQEYRAYVLKAVRFVDSVLLGMDDPQKLVSIVAPDIIAYGYDQDEMLKPKGVRIVKIDESLNPDAFKSSKIVGNHKE